MMHGYYGALRKRQLCTLGVCGSLGAGRIKRGDSVTVVD